MVTLLRWFVLPPTVTAFEAVHVRRLNRIALALFWLHLPVFALVAWACGTSVSLAITLVVGILGGPTLAFVALPARPRLVSLVYGVTATALGGVLVYVGRGPLQIEMHFYFFVVIALLAVFGNPLVVVVGAVSVAAHHVAMWLVVPAGVFNYDAGLTTVAVHALFVVVEAIAACFVARSFFDNVIGLEAIVTRRTDELKGAEVELRQAQKLEAVGRLAAGVAHELNTPLQFVSDSCAFAGEAAEEVLGLVQRASVMLAAVASRDVGAADAAASFADATEAAELDYLAERLPTALRRAQEGLARMTAIVRSMKEFSHPGQDHAPSELNRGLENTIEIARNEYKYVADVTTDLGDLPLVTCQLGELNQVFLNLIVNAAHAIGDTVTDGARGTIAVRTWVDGDHVKISIADTGTGIPDSIRDKIFDPFFTTKEVGKGTGQGLAIARTVVERHGGTITVETAVGAGTTFTISLPIDAAAQPLAA